MTEEPEILIEEEIDYDDATHTYTTRAGRHPPSVTGILSKLKFVDFSMVPIHLLEAAQVRGKAVHDCIQFIEEDDLDWSTVHEEIKPFLDAFLLFKEQTGFKSKVREKKLFCPTLFYCGRLDTIGEMAKLGIEEALMDYKSGAKTKGTKYQTAGYGVAENKPLIPRFSLHLKKNGHYDLVAHKGDKESWAVANERDYKIWRSIVTTYHALREVNGGNWK